MASSAAHSQVQGIQRQDLQAAIAKAVELRAVHAALLQGGGNSAAAMRLLAGAPAPLSRFSNQFSSRAEDYPVFTPTYEEDPLPGYHLIQPDGSVSENWSGASLEGEAIGDEIIVSGTKPLNYFSRNNEHLCFSTKARLPDRSLCLNRNPITQSAPKTEMIKSSSRRDAMVELRSMATKYAGDHATISGEANAEKKMLKSFNSTIPMVDIHTKALTVPLQSKIKGPIFSWLFHRTKKKPESDMSTAIDSEDMSQLLRDSGIFSVEGLKRELVEANEKRDSALVQVAEMRTSIADLQQKLTSLESYCEELKKALKQTVHQKEKLQPNISRRTKLVGNHHSTTDNSLPVSHGVMLEGFLQIVSEARLSVKHFCKNLINAIDINDYSLLEKLNMLLHPHQITMGNKNSKGVLYHLEALINQSLYQDYENCVFQKNGSPKALDPQQGRLENFSAFVTLRNLSWNEVLRKGTKHYSEEFRRFCDQKMNDIVSALGWTRPWPELLLHSFFVAAKCVWSLHLLAFSFNPALAIFRVDEGCSFDSLYMEDSLNDREHRGRFPARVKIMVMPGFYLQDKVLRCRVLCRHRSD
ncbi:hypothetical protein HPP92_018946 [Vanilla planifolia]|uniref:GIL1/IRKI C-terminal domain-containing protein n=1 Tax=Vanilla planifolia TaxID=51239 RepID=A0A835UPV4_VANPL|nr:hypothetical protein HPP92_018946 [Vanilla planifolia]